MANRLKFGRDGILTTFNREARVDVPVNRGSVITNGLDLKRVPFSSVRLRSARNIKGYGVWNWQSGSMSGRKHRNGRELTIMLDIFHCETTIGLSLEREQFFNETERTLQKSAGGAVLVGMTSDGGWRNTEPVGDKD